MPGGPEPGVGRVRADDPGVEVPFRRLRPDLEALRQAYPDDAGADLIAVEAGEVSPGATARIPTNVALAIPEGLYGMVTGRSSVASAGLLTHVGTVDAGYRGQVQVVVTNLAAAPYRYEPGQRIAQLILIPFARARYREVAELPPSPRGERGFGSSGR